MFLISGSYPPSIYQFCIALGRFHVEHRWLKANLNHYHLSSFFLIYFILIWSLYGLKAPAFTHSTLQSYPHVFVLLSFVLRMYIAFLFVPVNRGYRRVVTLLCGTSARPSPSYYASRNCYRSTWTMRQPKCDLVSL